MPRRLAYTLSFWLLGAVALSTLTMGGLTAWNLRQGFTAYLQARDMERFDKLARLLGTSLAASGDSLSAPPEQVDMPALLDRLAELDGVSPPPRPEFTEQSGQPRRPPQGMGPPPGGGEGFGSRVALARPDGQHWMGPRFAIDEPGVIGRTIEVGGQVVAIARLRARQRAPEANETQFLRTQYIGIAVLTSTLLLLALGCALWLARQWVRPWRQCRRRPPALPAANSTCALTWNAAMRLATWYATSTRWRKACSASRVPVVAGSPISLTSCALRSPSFAETSRQWSMASGP